MKDLNYRKDIDGLRAIAVLTVVLFHLDINGFSGGFVGVDIFFVISGYLITGIIQKQINKGNFSFSNFYQRRIQRILPLYYLVGFSSLFAAFFILLPSDFESFTSSFVAASVYLSNIYFWQDASGYFGLNSEQIPLLHTWSLSVEEQFYIFWPLTLFFLMSKFNRFYLLIITILLMVLSLSISEWAAVEGKSYAYFLLHTRAFELLIGASLVFLNRNNFNLFINNLLASIGLSLICLSVVLLDESHSFPGLNAFYSCLGAALLVYTGQKQTFIASVLSTRPFVSVGLISYSLYLWHWPPLAFIHYMQIEQTLLSKFLLLSLLIILSYLTWKFVETPCRNIKLKFLTSSAIFLFAPLILTVFISYYVINNNGMFNRFSEGVLEKVEFIENKFPNPKNCINVDISKESGRYCDYGVEIDKADLLLVGDSHANALIGALEVISEATSLKLHAVTNPGAPILLGVNKTSFNKNNIRTDLTKSNARFLEMINTHKFKYVVLGGRYSQYIEGELEHDNRPLYLSTPSRFSSSVLDNSEIFEESMGNNVSAIVNSGAIPIIILDVPEFEMDNSKCTIFRTPINCAISKNSVLARQDSALKIIERLQESNPTLILIDLKPLLCMI